MRRMTGMPLPLNGWRARAAMRANGPASTGAGIVAANMLATNRTIRKRDTITSFYFDSEIRI